MTQTITNCNTIPTGTMYPVSHLRTAESIEQLCEYVDAGHPIATRYGNQVRLFRKNADGYNFDIWYEEPNDDGSAQIDWVSECEKEPSLLPYIKLTPLAYKDGRPLHVGDHVIFGNDETGEDDFLMCVSEIKNLGLQEWGFA